MLVKTREITKGQIEISAIIRIIGIIGIKISRISVAASKIEKSKNEEKWNRKISLKA